MGVPGQATELPRGEDLFFVVLSTKCFKYHMTLESASIDNPAKQFEEFVFDPYLIPPVGDGDVEILSLIYLEKYFFIDIHICLFIEVDSKAFYGL